MKIASFYKVRKSFMTKQHLVYFFFVVVLVCIKCLKVFEYKFRATKVPDKNVRKFVPTYKEKNNTRDCWTNYSFASIKGQEWTTQDQIYTIRSYYKWKQCTYTSSIAINRFSANNVLPILNVCRVSDEKKQMSKIYTTDFAI